jgi:alginate O-acetyltransferase complex protein AlgJ
VKEHESHRPQRSKAAAGRIVVLTLFAALMVFLGPVAALPSLAAEHGVDPDSEPQPWVSPLALTYPPVIEGKKGWLFYGADASAPCKPEESITTIQAGFQKLADAASASGRTLVIAIAPDKSSAHPELMPDSFAGKACMTAQRAAFWDSLNALAGATVIDPKAALAAYEKEKGRSVWRKYDTHWAPEGAGVFASEIVSALDPKLLDSTRFVPGPREQSTGDLTALLGSTQSESVVSLTVKRVGVQLFSGSTAIAPHEVPEVGYSPITVTATSTDAPLYGPKTVLLGDSFFDASRSELAPFFSSLTYVHNMSGDIPGATETLAGELAGARTIIFEMVERSGVSGAISYEDPVNVDALAKAMLRTPVVSEKN